MRFSYKPVLLLSLVLMATLVGCRKGQREIADGVKKIPREQMIRIMADIELTEAALKVKQVKMPRDSVKLLAAKSYDSLYNFYGTTPEEFKENLRYYLLDMEGFQALSDSVIINLNRRKDSISNLPVPSDSLKTKTPDSLKTKTPDSTKTKIRIK